MNPSQADMETLAARVEKLESANRRWKSSSAIVLVFVVAILPLDSKQARGACRGCSTG
ncbi:MAG: hypothetical protein HRJ53_05225 [Acidobacteria bacterium Pan2503]|uniref:Uncharacterized protein n=1 Tax=Candidatus Acidiferrum panamense TaxID=2741543 RepID=A0A7V8NN56_9BACT|nr:hypothetical protein [Candidatus Acidoferrum panamensis]